MMDRPDFGPKVEAAAKAHALAEYPREACGLVVDGVYEPKANKAVDPHNAFEIDRRCWATKRKIQAVIHSHCAVPGSFTWSPEEKKATDDHGHAPWPSSDDMRQQVATGLPWAIIWTDGQGTKGPLWWGDFVLDEPLIGREFHPGVRDCYGLARAYYRQERGVTLPEFARDDEWWHLGDDLFREGFGKAGFVPVEGAARPGDAYLMAIRSDVPNHCAMVLQPGLILHHLSRRLSRREALGGWQSYITHTLRLES